MSSEHQKPDELKSSASEATALWRYRSFIIIIIKPFQVEI